MTVSKKRGAELCATGRHDFDRETQRCRRPGCQATELDHQQRGIFGGGSPDLEREASARIAQTGQNELWRNPCGCTTRNPFGCRCRAPLKNPAFAEGFGISGEPGGEADEIAEAAASLTKAERGVLEALRSTGVATVAQLARESKLSASGVRAALERLVGRYVEATDLVASRIGAQRWKPGAREGKVYRLKGERGELAAEAAAGDVRARSSAAELEDEGAEMGEREALRGLAEEAARVGLSPRAYLAAIERGEDPSAPAKPAAPSATKRLRVATTERLAAKTARQPKAKKRPAPKKTQKKAEATSAAEKQKRGRPNVGPHPAARPPCDKCPKIHAAREHDRHAGARLERERARVLAEREMRKDEAGGDWGRLSRHTWMAFAGLSRERLADDAPAVRAWRAGQDPFAWRLEREKQTQRNPILLTLANPSQAIRWRDAPAELRRDPRYQKAVRLAAQTAQARQADVVLAPVKLPPGVGPVVVEVGTEVAREYRFPDRARRAGPTYRHEAGDLGRGRSAAPPSVAIDPATGLEFTLPRDGSRRSWSSRKGLIG